MKIVSFYSYKGGVGRTKACANVAAYLYRQHGKKVLLWDWDLDAPGLHFYFNRKGIKEAGTIEMLSEYVRIISQQNRPKPEDLPHPREYITPLAEFSSDKSGRIDLITGGKYNENYNQRVIDFDWMEFYHILDGARYIEFVKQWLGTMDYDFVFIDSRTGITDYSGICNVQLPTINCVLTVANQQSIKGCVDIINSIENSEYAAVQESKRFILPILSRLDSNHPKHDEWIEEFTHHFHHHLDGWLPVQEEAGNSSKRLPTFFHDLVFRDLYVAATALNYVPEYSASEKILFEQKENWISSGTIRYHYATIGNYLQEIAVDGHIALLEKISEEKWLQMGETAEKRKATVAARFAYTQAGAWQQKVLDDDFQARLQRLRNAIYYNNATKIKDQYEWFGDKSSEELNSYQWFQLGMVYQAHSQSHFSLIKHVQLENLPTEGIIDPSKAAKAAFINSVNQQRPSSNAVFTLANIYAEEGQLVAARKVLDEALPKIKANKHFDQNQYYNFLTLLNKKTQDRY